MNGAPIKLSPSSPLFQVNIPSSVLEPGLYVVATPIGNLWDISLRALSTLAGVDLIVAEDTRTTKKLLSRYDISTPLRSYHEHNAAHVRPELIQKMKEGQRLALVSDAGTPLISDPGFKLVQAILEEKIFMTMIPGPSATLNALVLSGLPTDQFFFFGFLPHKSVARKQSLTKVKPIAATLIFFETLPRLQNSLEDMEEVLGDRPASICRELTKRFETFYRGSLSDLQNQLKAYETTGQKLKGEIVVVVRGEKLAFKEDMTDPQIREAYMDTQLRRYCESLSLKESILRLAQETGWPRKEIYARAVRLKQNCEE